MSQQQEFWEQHQPPTGGVPMLPSVAGGVAPGPAGVAPPPAYEGPPRVFEYMGEQFQDPGPQYTIDDVIGYLAETYPELKAGATFTTKEQPDGTVLVTISKVTGEKGATVTTAQVIERLNQIQPLSVDAIPLIRELEPLNAAGQIDVARLLQLGPRIEQALVQAERVSDESRRVVERCLELKPVPLPHTVPLGF